MGRMNGTGKRGKIGINEWSGEKNLRRRKGRGKTMEKEMRWSEGEHGGRRRRDEKSFVKDDGCKVT